MLTFERIGEHEQVVFCNDPASGLKAIIVIHDTTLGPALGGCRMRPYQSEDEALEDALRLSKGMTYKCAAADVDFGGGKAVIFGDPATDRTPALFRAFGQYVASLHGRFYTGTDMGTEPENFVETMKETSCVVGVPEEYGGHGDSSIPTSQGLINGLKATSRRLWHTEDLSGRTFAIQGLGKVGSKVSQYLLDEGADLVVSDISDTAIDDIKTYAAQAKGSAMVAPGDEIYKADADVFVPCAVGGTLNEQTIADLQVQAVVGSANNQLHGDVDADRLREKNILYAPDYIVNSGGMIQVADELHTQGPNKSRVLQKTSRIYDTLLDVYERAQKDSITTAAAADRYCEDLIETRMRRNSFFSHAKPPKWAIRH